MLVLAAAPLTLVPDTYTKTVSQSWDLERGGSVELHMPAGDLRVVPGNDSAIWISYTMRSNHPDFIGKVKPAFKLKSSAAVLRPEAPHNGSVDIELRVPSRTDLQIRVLAGDINIGPIAGNQNLETHAGDINIGLLANDDYGAVDASTHAGKVSAPFGKTKGWIGSCLEYDGPGKDRVHAHTFAGDVHLGEAQSVKVEAPDQPEKFSARHCSLARCVAAGDFENHQFLLRSSGCGPKSARGAFPGLATHF